MASQDRGEGTTVAPDDDLTPRQKQVAEILARGTARERQVRDAERFEAILYGDRGPFDLGPLELARTPLIDGEAVFRPDGQGVRANRVDVVDRSSGERISSTPISNGPVTSPGDELRVDLLLLDGAAS